MNPRRRRAVRLIGITAGFSGWLVLLFGIHTPTGIALTSGACLLVTCACVGLLV